MASSSADREARRASYRAAAQAKLDTCKTCPSFQGSKKHLERCGVCGCFIRLLILPPGSKCPAGRW